MINKILQKLSENWFNPFLTLFINFYKLPFKTAIKFPIYIYGCPVISDLSGTIELPKNVWRGMVRINKSNDAPSTIGQKFKLALRGSLIFKGWCRFGTGNFLCIEKGAKLSLGNNVRMSNNNVIAASNLIEFCSECLIGSNNQFFDYDFHYLVDLSTGRIKNTHKPIKIKEYTWIGNGCTILKGSTLGMGCVLGSNSVFTEGFGTIDNGLFVGNPVRQVKTNVTQLKNLYAEGKVAESFLTDNNKQFMLVHDLGIIDFRKFF